MFANISRRVGARSTDPIGGEKSQKEKGEKEKMKTTIELLEAKIQSLEEAKSTCKNASDLYYIDGMIEGLFFSIIQLRKAAEKK